MANAGSLSKLGFVGHSFVDHRCEVADVAAGHGRWAYDGSLLCRPSTGPSRGSRRRKKGLRLFDAISLSTIGPSLAADVAAEAEGMNGVGCRMRQKSC